MNKSKHKLTGQQSDLEQLSEVETTSEFDRQINQSLDHSIENLSPEIRRSLNQMRSKATTQPTRRLVLVPLVSTLGLALAIFMGWQITTKPITEETVFAEVLEVEIELLEELDFVYWINEETESAKL